MDPGLRSFLERSFVTEIGIRQVWPFVTFCNNDLGAHGTERRLFIDAPLKVGAAGSGTWHRDDDGLLVALGALSLTSIDSVRVAADDSLILGFDGGKELVVAGTPDALTTHDVWWFGPAIPQ